MFLVIDLRLRYTKALCFLDIPAGNRIPRTADEYLCMQLCGTSHLRNPEGCDFIAFKATNYHIREHGKTWLYLVFRTVRRGNPEKQGPPSARHLPSLLACDAGLSPLRSPLPSGRTSPFLFSSACMAAATRSYHGRRTACTTVAVRVYHGRRTSGFTPQCARKCPILNASILLQDLTTAPISPCRNCYSVTTISSMRKRHPP